MQPPIVVIHTNHKEVWDRRSLTFINSIFSTQLICFRKSGFARWKYSMHHSVGCCDVGYFPKGFFSKWQLPKAIFPSGNFPNVKFPKQQLPKSVLATALGPHCSLRRLRGSNLIFGKLPLGELHIRKLSLGKLSLGKSPLGNCLWEST